MSHHTKDFNEFAPYQSSQNLNIPPRELNGGLYTGEPFRPNAAYANFPAIPDAGYLIHYNLRSANPPPQALFQYPTNDRIGNNTAIMPGISKETGKLYNIACRNVDANTFLEESCKCRKCSFSKYAYL